MRMKLVPFFSPQSCPSFPPCVFMGCLNLPTERRREQLKPRVQIEAAGISKGVPEYCFSLQMMFLCQDWNCLIENYSHFSHSSFASSEMQLWSVHLECMPMYTYFTYSFWIYHAVFLQSHCRPLWKDHHRSWMQRRGLGYGLHVPI